MRTIIHEWIIFKITDPGFDVTANSHEEIVNKHKKTKQKSIWSACSVLQPHDLVVIEAVMSFSNTAAGQ